MVHDDRRTPVIALRDEKILGVPAVVMRVDLDRSDRIVAVCARGRLRQAVPILNLPLPKPPPGGAEWNRSLQGMAGRSISPPARGRPTNPRTRKLLSVDVTAEATRAPEEVRLPPVPGVGRER